MYLQIMDMAKYLTSKPSRNYLEASNVQHKAQKEALNWHGELFDAQRRIDEKALDRLCGAYLSNALLVRNDDARQACCKGCGAPRNAMTCDYCKRAD